MFISKQHAAYKQCLVFIGLCKITLSRSAVLYVVRAISLINQWTGKKTKQKQTGNDQESCTRLRHPEEQVTITLASRNNLHTWPIFCPLKKATLFFLPERAHKKVLCIIGTDLQHSLHNTSLAMVTKRKIQVSPLPKERGFRHSCSIADGYEFLILKLAIETDLQGRP